MEWEQYGWAAEGNRYNRAVGGARVATFARRLLVRERARARRLEAVLFLAQLRGLGRQADQGRDPSGANG